LDDSDNDAQEGEEAPTHTFDDDSEDDTADSQHVLSFVGAAQAPSKYKILESCPSLETEENMQQQNRGRERSANFMGLPRKVVHNI
jgi:hypothetical protein